MQRIFWTAVFLISSYHQAPAIEFSNRWVYCQTNLLVDKNINFLEDLFKRSANAGYNGIVLTDSKFGRLHEMPQKYFQNAAKVKKFAEDQKLEIIPEVFPIGYSDSLLSQDINLVEALPVRDALLVVQDGVAKSISDPPIKIKGGDCEHLDLWDWKDPTVQSDKGTAHVSSPGGKNARMVQKLKVKPFHQYHLSARVKTQDFRDTALILLLAGPKLHRSLNHAHLGVKPTQDWKVHHAVFNSLDFDEVNLYIRAGWEPKTGDLWWDDIQIEEVAFLNLVRRDSTPVMIKTETGKILEEGKDFEPLIDPKMGTQPWKGSYDVWHEPPVLKLRTSLPNGTRLLASYHHAITTDNGKVMICPSEPYTLELLRDQAKRIRDLWKPKTYFMAHDEIRVLNWDDSCTKRNLTSGQLLADNAKTCTQILKDLDPKCSIYVWNDMFDPHHNAGRKTYYLARGDFDQSWEGLSPDIGIANWNFGHRKESLKFFADRGHPQLIAGYYDHSPEKIQEWLQAAKNIPGITGIMYTTWEKKYNDLERFADLIKEFK